MKETDKEIGDKEHKEDGDEEEQEWKDEETEDDKETKSESSIDYSPERKPAQSSTGRVPEGWSQRPKGSGARGPLPTCKGCKVNIRRATKCMRHRWKTRGHMHATTDQFHCKVGCLKKVDRASLEAMVTKHWTDKHVEIVVKKLDRKLNLSP